MKNIFLFLVILLGAGCTTAHHDSAIKNAYIKCFVKGKENFKEYNEEIPNIKIFLDNLSDASPDSWWLIVLKNTGIYHSISEEAPRVSIKFENINGVINVYDIYSSGWWKSQERKGIFANDNIMQLLLKRWGKLAELEEYSETVLDTSSLLQGINKKGIQDYVTLKNSSSNEKRIQNYLLYCLKSKQKKINIDKFNELIKYLENKNGNVSYYDFLKITGIGTAEEIQKSDAPECIGK